MKKYTVSYTTFTGAEVARDIYLHLNKKEIAELNALYPEGLQKRFEKLSANPEDPSPQDLRDLLELFEKIITTGYGVPSEDGERFVKTKDGVKLGDQFVETPAYSAFLDDVISDENLAKSVIEEMVKTNSLKNVVK